MEKQLPETLLEPEVIAEMYLKKPLPITGKSKLKNKSMTH
ncbi:hypothetical protein BN1180_03373 [Peribacillus simplex]|uniref:Uncharacterized protein n=1 Tax=Peribacillus simplex TaxID=1478 RepID=A0AAN2PJ10_9BACI|nr:hypothetical protein BN1180_03373 [Peribacillus simplex]